MKLSRLSVDDIQGALTFWRESHGTVLGTMHTAEGFESFLKRNPGLSFKVTDRDAIVGTILCGHDGSRGYLHHLAVADGYSKVEIGTTLIDRTLKELAAHSIGRCHVFIEPDNVGSEEFWRSVNWRETSELRIFSHDIEFPGP